MEAYERLVKLVHEAEDDVKKAAGGNKAAGTRVRKAMQDVRQAAQELRVAILAAREVEPAPATPGKTASAAKPSVPPKPKA
ncbi:MAG: histone H1 [Phycisphaerae bacterium]|nr:histone H1 [Phycisphaerae bacterium]